MEKKTVKISYLLSSEGQKKSLLAGGDGKKEQEVEAEITAETLEVAEIDNEGNVTIDLTRALCNKMHVAAALNPYIYREHQTFYFDDIQTPEVLARFEKNRQKKMIELEKSLHPELEIALSNAAKKEAELKVEEEKREKRLIALKAEKEKNEAERLAERLAWIEAHGSDYLQRAVKLGYNCQRQYVTERATLEFPGFALDFNLRAEWQDRTCPSSEALDEVEKLIQQGHKALVVWLCDTGVEQETTEDDDYINPFEPCEAIIVEDYLGKYNLVKEF